jgi:hypothetical protein
LEPLPRSEFLAQLRFAHDRSHELGFPQASLDLAGEFVLIFRRALSVLPAVVFAQTPLFNPIRLFVRIWHSEQNPLQDVGAPGSRLDQKRAQQQRAVQVSALRCSSAMFRTSHSSHATSAQWHLHQLRSSRARVSTFFVLEILAPS